MSLFIETIKLENGDYKLLGYHSKRLNNTLLNFFNKKPAINLPEFLPKAKELDEYKRGIYKCRVIYGETIENIEISPYKKRNITRLKIVRRDIDYGFKSTDRKCFSDILEGLSANENTDILIVKNGYITDTSFSNIMLFDGREWITPDTFLLNGVKRQYLLDNKKIKEERVSIGDLKHFKKVSLINAMLEPQEIEIDMRNIS